MNLSKSIKFNQIMGEMDTRTIAQEWMIRNIPDKATIAMDVDFAMPKVPLSRESISKKLAGANSMPGVKRSQITRLEFLLATSERKGFNLYSLSDKNQLQSSEFLMDKEKIAYDFEELKSKGVGYVLIVRLWERDIHQDFYSQLLAKGDLIAQFNPYKNQSSAWALDHPLTGGPFTDEDVARRERNGQPLYLYKLRP